MLDSNSLGRPSKPGGSKPKPKPTAIFDKFTKKKTGLWFIIIILKEKNRKPEEGLLNPPLQAADSFFEKKSVMI